MKAITKTFKNKQITIRPLASGDLKQPEKFRNFINSLVEEKALISRSKKVSVRQESIFLENSFKKQKNKRGAYLIAEDKAQDMVIGIADIVLSGNGARSHTGNMGVLVRKNYRGVGLGSCLLKEIIKLSKKELKPKLKIIRLSVFSANKPAIKLYRKFGFKKAAKIPGQFEYQGKLLDEIVMLLYL